MIKPGANTDIQKLYSCQRGRSIVSGDCEPAGLVDVWAGNLDDFYLSDLGWQQTERIPGSLVHPPLVLQKKAAGPVLL